CALVHVPDLLLLDEPTTGVDAVSRREFWDLLDHLKASGMTIVASTPYMDEANRCDRVALVQRGRLLMVDTPAAVAQSFDAPLFGVRAHDRYRVLCALRTFGHARSVYPFGEVLHYTDRRPTQRADEIAGDVTAFLGSKGFEGIAVDLISPTVEDTFIALMAASGESAELDRLAHKEKS
ncbi:MAG TPA: hypothetical protein VNZ26_19315, partial [Vicinamibacterales bacterium]|nr:hypothetical protein [Vicinamibacterales bacterium]